MTDYRRFLVSIGAFVSTSCDVYCFVPHGSSFRFYSHVVGPGAQQSHRTRPSNGDRPYQSQPVLSMTARGGDDETPSSGGPMDRRQALSKVWKAALSLVALDTAAVVMGGVTPAEAGIGEDVAGFFLPPQDQPNEIVVGDSDKEVSFEDFQRALLKGEVSKCEFYGANFDKAVIVLKDGTRALIGEGYPEERAFSDDGPMNVVALIRNSGVPYTTQFRMTKYTKPKSYKSSETLEAENRQRSEDQALELLMMKTP